MEVFNTIAAIPGVGPYLPYLMALISIAAVIAAFVPAPSATSGAAYRVLYEALSWCAANKGRAANAEVVKDAPHA